MAGPQRFAAECPSRQLLDQIVDKWSMMVLAILEPGPLRFNAIRRQIEGVTQKALTQCLRRLERNGLVERRVIPSSPIAVEYELTGLGQSLRKPFSIVYDWTIDNLPAVDVARSRFDHRSNEAKRLAETGSGSGSQW